MANLKPLHALNLDINQQKNFIKFFKTLSEKPATTIRFFDRSEYYSCHGVDAPFVAKSVFKSTAVIKIMAPAGIDEELPYVVLSKTNFENLIRELLLIKNFRVEVYTVHGSSKSSNDWTLEFKGSPGNLSQFEETLFSNNEMVASSALIAINIRQDGKTKMLGLSCIDTNDRVFAVCEFADDDFFAELEAVIVLLGPKECLIPSTDGDFGEIEKLMVRNGVMVSVRSKREFYVEKSELIQDLNKLLSFKKGQQESANTLPEVGHVLAMSALGAAIKYLGLISNPVNYERFELKMLNLNRFVHLDAAAVSALNIFPKPGTNLNTPAFRWQSILGVLDRCKTPQGHRLIAQWLKQPLRNFDLIKDRHDIVECFLDSTTIRTELHENHIKKMPDILPLIKKVIQKKAKLQDIFKLYQVVIRLPKLLRVLATLENVTVSNIIYDPMKDSLRDLALFQQMVEQVLDLEAIEKGEYLIKSSFDDQLQKYKDKMNEIEGKIEKLFSKVSDDLGFDRGSNIKLDSVSHLGFHFRLSLKDESILRKNNKYKILDAVKGGVRFTNEKLTSYNEDFAAAREEYEETQTEIVVQVVKIAEGYMGPWQLLNNQIAQLDCFLSLAVAAASAPEPYVRPKMLEEGTGTLELKGLRHPCLELQEDVNYIANDAHFKKDVTNMYIITGPNMGGKSTYIRSVGVAVYMAHIGSFVPCSEAKISIVDSILGRVGAGDNLSKGLSTFMVEMIETSGIIRTATDKSLVIIDELGRGTSTYEGCGIAWSIAEHLAKETKSFTLFATHFHEITELAETVDTVKNCHMYAIADNDNFTLLYQVKPGVMEKSFGIQVAKLASFPSEVVDNAQKLYDECEDHFGQLKSEKDDEATKVFEEAMDKIGTIDINDEEIEKLVSEVQRKVKNSNSNYFKATFPTVFES